MKRELLLQVVFLASLAACSAVDDDLQRSSGGRIVNGTDTTVEEIPFQGQLVYFDSHRCGVSIISEYWVITAAHCTYSIPADFYEYLQIRVGSSSINSGGRLHSVSRVISYENFTEADYKNDVSVIEVYYPIEFGAAVQPVELAYSDFTLPDDTMLDVSGWGRLYDGGSQPDLLQVVSVPLINRTYCAAVFAGAAEITDKMICAGYKEGGRDACQGDSGGPLFYGNILVGIVSWGSGCAEPNTPGVYADVAHLRSWITENTGLDLTRPQIVLIFSVHPAVIELIEKIDTVCSYNLAMFRTALSKGILIPFLIIGVRCGPAGKIVGGTATTINNYPYLVSIIYNKEHVCGGSLISNQWILTAAHCIDGLKTSLFNVRVGSTYRTKGGTLVTAISSIVTHELYDDDSYDYDVGLIRLASALTLSNAVKTVILPSSTYTVADRTSCAIAGWGKTSYGGAMSQFLLALTVPIVSQKVCYDTFIHRNTVTARMICAGYTTGAKDTCQGDSGGPLVCNKVQVGIVSWGAGCAAVGYPGVYSRVSALRDWIKKKTNV
ncbi:transmembrane protease serine 9-like [Athalia rosae]|uniref:transmembrane protease serine 9-like n=1 Tax=Athalia rosae TaxID=37344 RepID=UPI0020345834|nr:transmembrane protease serine 9-like [Athalia rosae]